MCNGFKKVNPFNSSYDIVVNLPLARLLLLFYCECPDTHRSAVPTNTPVLAITARTAHLGSALPPCVALAEAQVIVVP